MHILYKKSFQKSYQNLKTPLQDKVDGVIQFFMQDPFDKKLRNHVLKGARSGCRSIDVTGDVRIIFRELSDGTYELVELVHVGTHSQLYG